MPSKLATEHRYPELVTRCFDFGNGNACVLVQAVYSHRELSFGERANTKFDPAPDGSDFDFARPGTGSSENNVREAFHFCEAQNPQ